MPIKEGGPKRDDMQGEKQVPHDLSSREARRNLKYLIRAHDSNPDRSVEIPRTLSEIQQEFKPGS